MRKAILIGAAVICLTATLSAQYPNLTTFTVAPAAITYFPQKSEVPPWIIGGSADWRSYFMVDGIGSSVISSEGSPISLSSIPSQTGPNQTTSPLGACPWIHFGTLTVNTSISGVRDAANEIDLTTGFVADANSTGEFFAEVVPGYPSGQDWQRTYYGIYSAQYFNHPAQGPVSIGFIHAENKTRCISNSICQNTINTLQLATSCPNGDDWERYNSFVCAAWIPNTQATNWGQQYFPNDMGPIVWPSTGYLQPNAVKFTTGVNVPSSIQFGGYMYVFFHDSGPYGSPGSAPFYPPPAEEGRYEGVKVARAPLSDALNPRAWQVFYRDPNGVETWHPSLPQGFTKETMAYFWNLPGPKSTVILGTEGSNTFGGGRFSVAQVRNTNYFIGIESYTDLTDPVPGTPGAYRIKKALRYSADLVHWTDRQRIIETVDDWTQSKLNYPALLGSDGWSNNIVDSNDFYVVGTNSVIGTQMNKVHVYRITPGPQFSSSIGSSTANALENGRGTVTGIYPNPGAGAFQLSYTLNTNAQVQVNVLDITGRRLQTGTAAAKPPGSYVDVIDITAYTKGMYLVELLVNGNVHTFKVVYQ